MHLFVKIKAYSVHLEPRYYVFNTPETLAQISNVLNRNETEMLLIFRGVVTPRSIFQWSENQECQCQDSNPGLLGEKRESYL